MSHESDRPVSPGLRREFAPTGVLRIAINLGNPVLAQRVEETDGLGGVSVDLARELARRLELEPVFAAFDAAARVVDAVAAGAVDVVFLAIDPLRARDILFTAPYVVIEGTYLVRDEQPFRTVAELDRPGLRIAVGAGAAYDLYLTRTLKHAELVRAGTSAGAVELFVAQGLEAAAGVRQPLARYARDHAGVRVLDGAFTAIQQAMGVPAGREGARRYLHQFVETMKAEGFVAAALQRSGQGDAGLAPPADAWPRFPY